MRGRAAWWGNGQMVCKALPHLSPACSPSTQGGQLGISGTKGGGARQHQCQVQRLRGCPGQPSGAALLIGGFCCQQHLQARMCSVERSGSPAIDCFMCLCSWPTPTGAACRPRPFSPQGSSRREPWATCSVVGAGPRGGAKAQPRLALHVDHPRHLRHACLPAGHLMADTQQ